MFSAISVFLIFNQHYFLYAPYIIDNQLIKSWHEYRIYDFKINKMNTHHMHSQKGQNPLIYQVERKLDWFFEELIEFINQEDEN